MKEDVCLYLVKVYNSASVCDRLCMNERDVCLSAGTVTNRHLSAAGKRMREERCLPVRRNGL